jgi:hypothetical protein
MRTTVLCCVLGLLAGALTGCGGLKKSAGEPVSHSEAASGSKTAPKPAAPDFGGFFSGGSPGGFDNRAADGDKEGAAKDAPVATKPAMDDPHTGTDRPNRDRSRDLPAGVLTAGSFDDNLYPQYFRSFLNKAGQNQYAGSLAGKLLGQRVEVFVKNGAGSPVGNARVTVGAAGGGSVGLITRSDGRAVFVASLDQVNADGELTVTVTAPEGGAPVKQVVEKGANRCTVILPDAPAPLPRNLDLTIVLDTTGSMGDELQYLKSEVKSIASAVHDRFPNVHQRYALVCYRDEGMGDEYVTRKFDFTTDVEQFRKNLSAQSAAGGGDIPEAMQKGLEEATKLPWRDADTARVVFLIADAPPHARDALTTLDHVNTLRKKGVAVYPVFASCNDREASEATELVMRSFALITGGQYLFLTDDSGVGDAHAEPHIPHYHVEKLNALMVRMIAGELSGKRLDPDPKDVIRTVGQPPKRGRQD